MYHHDETCNASSGEACTCKRTEVSIAGADLWTPTNGVAIKPSRVAEANKNPNGLRVRIRYYGRLGELL